MQDPTTNLEDIAALEAAAQANDSAFYVLRLYITGTSPQSTRALLNIRQICEEHLAGRYQLDVVDVSQNPELAKDAQVIASPTLIKQLPLPLRRFIGDMSKTDRLVLGLDLRQAQDEPDGDR